MGQSRRAIKRPNNLWQQLKTLDCTVSIPIRCKFSGPTFPQSRFVVRCHVTTWVAGAGAGTNMAAARHLPTPPWPLDSMQKTVLQVWASVVKEVNISASPLLTFHPLQSTPALPFPSPPRPAAGTADSRLSVVTCAQGGREQQPFCRRRNPTSYRMTNSL